MEWAYFHERHPYKFLVNKRTEYDIDNGLDLAYARVWLDMESLYHRWVQYGIIHGSGKRSLKQY